MLILNLLKFVLNIILSPCGLLIKKVVELMLTRLLGSSLNQCWLSKKAA